MARRTKRFKTSGKVLLKVLLVFSLIAVVVVAIKLTQKVNAQVNGYSFFQLTHNDSQDSDVVMGGQYLAWIEITTNGAQYVSYSDVLTGRSGRVTSDTSPKKDVQIGLNSGVVVWAQGEGTSTDIFGFDPERSFSFRVTSNGQNNHKPKIVNQVIAWAGSDGANTQIYYTTRGTLGSATQVTTGASNKDNPYLSNPGNGNQYMIAWEDENGGISYFQNASSSTFVAHSPGAGCTDKIGDINGKLVAFIEDCPTTDIARVFFAGADLSVSTDDTLGQTSATGQTESRTPDLDGTHVVWVEGTGTASEIWGCNISNCDGTRVQVTNNSVLDDDPHIGGGIGAWHRENADTTHDILAYNIPAATTYQVTDDAVADTAPRLKEIGSTGTVWGAWVRTPSDGTDTEIFVAVPKVSTPVGTNVVVTPGNGTSITFPTVSSEGNTTFITKSLFSEPGTPLTGFQLGSIPTYFDISTTAVWTGTATVCLQYNQLTFNDNENLLQILHAESDTWVDRTTSLNTETNIICAGVTSFSEIAFAVRDQTIISSVTPAKVSFNSDTEITINGLGFLTGPKLRLGDVELQNVQYIDSNRLRATIPAKMKKGTYTLSLENRYGSGGELIDAVAVVAPGQVKK